MNVLKREENENDDTISQSIAYTFRLGFLAGSARSDSLGSSGTSNQPADFWNTSAMYEGTGYSFSIIWSSDSIYREGSFSIAR
jgi:hypothetical protein